MKLKILLIIISCAGNVAGLFGQEKLTVGDDFTLLNARFGSRFTCSFSGSERGVRTGSLGFDMDEIAGFLVSLGDDCLETSFAPNGYNYFKQQDLDFGFTWAAYSASRPDGVNLNFKLVSPFTSSTTLEDSSNLKTQIVPAFYLIVTIENGSSDFLEEELKLGLNRTPVNDYNHMAVRSYSINQNLIYYRDPGAGQGKLVLSAQNDYQRFYNESGFSGLRQVVRLQPGETYQDTLVYATYYDDEVIYDRARNQELVFYYTQLWDDVDEVLSYSWKNADQNLNRSARFESAFADNNISPAEKWVAALSFHNDLANAFLLVDENQDPRFYLVEGRFQHLSTIDVAHDTEVMAIFAPWRLKMQLRQWTDYLALREVTVSPNPGLNKGEYREGMTAAEYGPFLFHDVGDLPFVDATSNYNYGPNMAVEENSDFILLLYWYWKLTGDDQFVQSMTGLVDVLLQSNANRDTDNSGIVDTGYGWTTYDVNQALKLAPENVYLGVKQYCANVVGAEMLVELSTKSANDQTVFEDKASVADGEGVGFNAPTAVKNYDLRKKQADKYLEEADKIYKTLSKASRKYGYLPVSLDAEFENWDQRSVVLGEGLFLPGLAGSKSTRLQKLASLLSEDYPQALEVSKTSYGIKLASNEGATWFSKTMVADMVASYWYDIDNSSADYAYEWNRNNQFAYNDGAFSAERNWTGYWYPRGISSLVYFFRNQKLTARQILETYQTGGN